MLEHHVPSAGTGNEQHADELFVRSFEWNRVNNLVIFVPGRPVNDSRLVLFVFLLLSKALDDGSQLFRIAQSAGWINEELWGEGSAEILVEEGSHSGGQHQG